MNRVVVLSFMKKHRWHGLISNKYGHYLANGVGGNGIADAFEAPTTTLDGGGNPEHCPIDVNQNPS